METVRGDHLDNDAIFFIKTMLATAFGMLTSILGALTVPFLLLVTANVIDYITGIWSARSQGIAITSGMGIRGIYKKVGMYFLIVVGFMIDCLFKYAGMELQIVLPPQYTCLVALIICTWLLVNELISIVENLDRIGVRIPLFLKPLLRLIKGKIEKEYDVKEDEEDGK